MSDVVEEQAEDLVLECEFDEPPEKVWRAVSIGEFRDQWLPERLLADAEPISSVPGAEVRYRMRDDEPPFLASTVTFEVTPLQGGGTRLRIVHRLADELIDNRPRAAANSNGTCMMRAA